LESPFKKFTHRAKSGYKEATGEREKAKGIVKKVNFFVGGEKNKKKTDVQHSYCFFFLRYKERDGQRGRKNSGGGGEGRRKRQIGWVGNTFSPGKKSSTERNYLSKAQMPV